MVITEDFVYIHLPKTGGTFVEHVLRRLFDELGVWYLDTSRAVDRAKLGSRDKHETVRDIPRNHRGKPVLFTIRNPYGWYVSQYEFAWWKVEPDREFDCRAMRAQYHSYPELAFHEFVAAINDWRLRPRAERANAAAVELTGSIGIFTSLFVRFLALFPHPAFAALQPRGSTGLAAVLYPGIEFLRTDRLHQDLHDWLIRSGFAGDDVDFILDADRIGRRGSETPLAPGEQTRITSREKRTHHAPAAWWDYYDGKLRTFVRRRERLLFELFPEFDECSDPTYRLERPGPISTQR